MNRNTIIIILIVVLAGAKMYNSYRKKAKRDKERDRIEHNERMNKKSREKYERAMREYGH
jgi:hypothetical protein